MDSQSQKHAYDVEYDGQGLVAEFDEEDVLGAALTQPNSQNEYSGEQIQNSLSFSDFALSQGALSPSMELAPLLEVGNDNIGDEVMGNEQSDSFSIIQLKGNEFNGVSEQSSLPAAPVQYQMAYLTPVNQFQSYSQAPTVRFLTAGNLQTPSGGMLKLAHQTGHSECQYLTDPEGGELELSQGPRPNEEIGVEENIDIFNTSFMNNISSGESQSQNTSTDNLTTFTDYPGNYHFQVEPVEKTGKKCVLWAEENKIFCNNSVEIMFAVGVNFREAPVRALHVEAALYYKDMEQISKPVERCKSCYDSDLEKEETIDLAGHVLTCCDAKAEHKRRTSGSRECYTSFPLRKPAEGDNDLKVNYKFNCLSSCKAKDGIHGINRRELVLLFVLRDANNKTLGRKSFKIKICKCPRRDCSLEMTGAESGSNGKSRKRAKKGQKGRQSQEVDVAPKRTRLSTEIPISCRTALDAVGCTSVRLPIPPTVGLSPMDSEHIHDAPRSVETFTQELLSQNNDSQGHLHVRISGNFLTNIARDVRLALHIRGLGNDFANDLGESMLTQLRAFRKSGRLLRNYYKGLFPDWDPEQDDFMNGEEIKEEDIE